MAAVVKKKVAKKSPVKKKPRAKKIVVKSEKPTCERAPRSDRKLEELLGKLEFISDLYSNGANHDIVAKELGIARSTWFKYKAENEIISDCVKRGIHLANSKIQSALFRKAFGEKKEDIIIETKSGEPPKIKKIIRDIQGDFNAQKFWLINRDSEDWKVDVKVQHTGPNDGAIQLNKSVDLAAMSDEELILLARIVEKHSASEPE